MPNPPTYVTREGSQYHVEADQGRVDTLSTENVWLGQQPETPTDDEIGSGNTAIYAKSDGNLYKKPHGGSELQVGGDGGAFSDSDGDNIAELDSSLTGVSLSNEEKILLGNDDNFEVTASPDGKFRLYDRWGNLYIGITPGNSIRIQDKTLLASAGVDLNGSNLSSVNTGRYNPQDVRNISSPSQGWTAYHDGSGSNSEGIAEYRSDGSWYHIASNTEIS